MAATKPFATSILAASPPSAASLCSMSKLSWAQTALPKACRRSSRGRGAFSESTTRSFSVRRNVTRWSPACSHSSLESDGNATRQAEPSLTGAVAMRTHAPFHGSSRRIQPPAPFCGQTLPHHSMRRRKARSSSMPAITAEDASRGPVHSTPMPPSAMGVPNSARSTGSPGRGSAAARARAHKAQELSMARLLAGAARVDRRRAERHCNCAHGALPTRAQRWGRRLAARGATR